MPEEPKQKVIIDENFSTANVDLGKIKENSNFNIGKLLNVANSLGVIPGLNDESNNSNSANKLPIMDLFNMMGSLSKDNNNMEDIKNKMDTFLEQKLGLDVKKINEDLENLIKSKKLETEKE